MTALKRFIAGVVCPRCKTMDTIRSWRDEQASCQYRECVKCDFTDSQPLEITAEELETRVNRPRPAADAGIQAVRMLIPDTTNDKD